MEREVAAMATRLESSVGLETEDDCWDWDDMEFAEDSRDVKVKGGLVSIGAYRHRMEKTKDGKDTGDMDIELPKTNGSEAESGSKTKGGEAESSVGLETEDDSWDSDDMVAYPDDLGDVKINGGLVWIRHGKKKTKDGKGTGDMDIELPKTKGGEAASGSRTKRGEAASGSRTKRGEAASGSMTKRGEAVSGSMTKRGEAASGSMTKRGEAGSKTKRGEAASGSMTKRGEAASGSMTKRGEAGSGSKTKRGEAHGEAKPAVAGGRKRTKIVKYRIDKSKKHLFTREPLRFNLSLPIEGSEAFATALRRYHEMERDIVEQMETKGYAEYEREVTDDEEEPISV